MSPRLMILAVAAIATACLLPPGGASAAKSEVALGRRLYRDGIAVDGRPIRARTQGDVPIIGSQAACINCHRPSGLGSSEGGYYVPPVNAPLLFAPRKLDRLRLFPFFFHQIQTQRFKTRLYQPHMRPAYTRATLGRVLRTGIDPGGNRLAKIMPRYSLSDADLTAIDAYLHTLSAHIDPGVDKRQIHFATVFSDNVPAAERKAMLSVLRVYLQYHNLRLNEDLQRHTFAPYNRSDFVPIERAWTLKVWNLKGAPSTWRTQLEHYYRKDQVFALIGGKVRGPWAGPSAFCDAHHIPCLFPDTQLPVWPPIKYGYTVYFDAGLALEARAVADYLRGHHPAAGTRIMQLAAADAYGQEPGRIFRKTLGSGSTKLRDASLTFHNRAELEADLRRVRGHRHTILVIWPGLDVTVVTNALKTVRPEAARIFLPSRAIRSARSTLPAGIASRLRFPYPYEVNPGSHVKSYLTRAWLHTRGVTINYPTLEFEEYYAMSLLEAGLWEISNDFYRDYLIERMEDQSQEDFNPGMYPRLVLGPGERFAAKGVYIVALDGKPKPGRPGVRRVSAWIAP